MLSKNNIHISSVQWQGHVQLFATSWTACQAYLYFTNSGSLLKLMSIKLVMPSNHLIVCPPLLLPSIFPSIRVFSNESAVPIRWPKYWRFSFSISPSTEYSNEYRSRDRKREIHRDRKQISGCHRLEGGGGESGEFLLFISLQSMAFRYNSLN